MSKEARLHGFSLKQNTIEVAEMERLRLVLGVSDKAEVVRIAIKFMLADQKFDQSTGMEITEEGNINLVYNGMIRRLRLELFSVTETLLRPKRMTVKEKEKFKGKLKLIKELLSVLSESRKEEFMLNDVIPAGELAKLQLKSKELEIKSQHNKVQKEYIEHQKRMSIIDRK